MTRAEKSGYIGRIRTDNCGTIVNTPYGMAELLGPGYSTHPKNMVVVYTNEGDTKISVVYYGDGCTVYRFHGLDNNQHYWSRGYSVSELLESKKYSPLVGKAQAIARIYGMY